MSDINNWARLLAFVTGLVNQGLLLQNEFFFADDGSAGEEVTMWQNDRSYGFQRAALLCFVVIADSLLGRIEGHEETVWFWLLSGRWELISMPGLVSVMCHLLFWSVVVPHGNGGIRGN